MTEHDDEDPPRELPTEVCEIRPPQINGVNLRLERYKGGAVVIRYWKGKKGYHEKRTGPAYLLGIIEDPREQVRLASFLVRP